MSRRIQRTITIILLFVLISPAAFAANFFSTNREFFGDGAGAFIGKVTDVQVLSSTKNSESGTVQLEVMRVIAGNVASPSVTFSYQRALAPEDEEGNWDLVEPKYVSLKIAALDKEFLIFFTRNDRAYLMFQSSNSVQDANSGILIGKIRAQRDQCGAHNAKDREVQIEIVEMIYGWIGMDGSLVTLPFASHHTCADSSAADRQAQLNMEPLDGKADFGDRKLIITFDETGICEVTTASDKLLESIRQLDSEQIVRP